jgi:hypothetical protein
VAALLYEARLLAEKACWEAADAVAAEALHRSSSPTARAELLYLRAHCLSRLRIDEDDAASPLKHDLLAQKRQTDEEGAALDV